MRCSHYLEVRTFHISVTPSFSSLPNLLYPLHHSKFLSRVIPLFMHPNCKMLSLITWGFLAQLFISSANSQNNSAATCADINGYVQYNSSTTRQLQALKLQGNRTSENYAVVNDSSRIWELSYRVQKQPTNHNTYKSNNDGKHFYGTMFLDTKDSNMTNLGSCHQTLQAEIGGQGYTLSKLVLERSVNDNGDCTAMLGQDCVSAIKQRSMYQASEWPLRTGSCARMNGTIPAECDGLGLRPFMSARRKCYIPSIVVNLSLTRLQK
jgi:hypothetical protein